MTIVSSRALGVRFGYASQPKAPPDVVSLQIITPLPELSVRPLDIDGRSKRGLPSAVLARGIPTAPLAANEIAALVIPRTDQEFEDLHSLGVSKALVEGLRDGDVQLKTTEEHRNGSLKRRFSWRGPRQLLTEWANFLKEAIASLPDNRFADVQEMTVTDVAGNAHKTRLPDAEHIFREMELAHAPKKPAPSAYENLCALFINLPLKNFFDLLERAGNLAFPKLTSEPETEAAT